MELPNKQEEEAGLKGNNGTKIKDWGNNKETVLQYAE